MFRPFLEELRKLGYIDGHNIVLERRFAGGHYEIVSEFVADLVARNIDIIVVTGPREVVAAKQATSRSDRMIANPDPIGMGLVTSLARPGGNVIGLTTMDRASTASALKF